METDGPLKLLFQHCADLLLPLTGDVGAAVRSAGPAEIQALHRRADCVLELEKDGETYYRHLEFEDRPNPAMAARCFEYNSQLILRRKAPVLTTVIYLQPPRPKEPLVFRVTLAGREVNRWRFDEIYLWDMDARETLKSAGGFAPLTPLMRGGTDLDVIAEAVHRIPEVFPEDRRAIAEEVLLAFARQHYTISSLSPLVGRERMAQLRAYTEALAEGRLQAGREMCSALMLKHHPEVFAQLRPVIETCTDPATLELWALSATDMDDAEMMKLVRGA
jgi:hypothetical protein